MVEESQIQDSRKTHICYVSHDSLAEGIGMSQIRPLVKCLAKTGWKVSLVTMEKNRPPNELVSEMRECGVDWRILEFGRRGVIAGGMRFLRLLLRIPNADLYHCRGDLSALSVTLKRKPFLWDVRGLWGEQKFVIGSIRKTKVTTSIFRALEWIAARNASSVSVLASPLINVLESRNGKLPQIQAIIPTCVDLDLFKFVPILPEVNTILLSGVFNDYYDVNRMSQIINHLKKDMNFRVIWCKGAEADREKLNVCEDQVRIRKQSEMPAEIAESSLGMAICKTSAGISLRGVMPTKVGEFLAVGRPVIVSQGMGDLDEMINNHRVGLVYKEGDEVADLARGLSALFSDPQLSYRCRFVAEQYFDMKEAALKYQAIYNKMLHAS